MRTLILAALAASPSAFAADFDVDGSCVGPVTLTATGYTPNSRLYLLRSDDLGSTSIPAGPCAGTTVGLDSARLLGRLRTDASGNASLTTTVPPGFCGVNLAVVDPSTCAVSQIEALSRVAGCEVNMDATCPDSVSECGLTFSGAGYCGVPNYATCTTTGSSSYVIPAGQTVRIDSDEPINETLWMLAAINSGTFLTTRYDVDGNAILTSGTAGFECDVGPVVETISDGSIPVYAYEITAVGGEGYLDSIVVNP